MRYDDEGLPFVSPHNYQERLDLMDQKFGRLKTSVFIWGAKYQIYPSGYAIPYPLPLYPTVPLHDGWTTDGQPENRYVGSLQRQMKFWNACMVEMEYSKRFTIIGWAQTHFGMIVYPDPDAAMTYDSHPREDDTWGETVRASYRNFHATSLRQMTKSRPNITASERASYVGAYSGFISSLTCGFIIDLARQMGKNIDDLDGVSSFRLSFGRLRKPASNQYETYPMISPSKWGAILRMLVTALVAETEERTTYAFSIDIVTRCVTLLVGCHGALDDEGVFICAVALLEYLGICGLVPTIYRANVFHTQMLQFFPNSKFYEIDKFNQVKKYIIPPSNVRSKDAVLTSMFFGGAALYEPNPIYYQEEMFKLSHFLPSMLAFAPSGTWNIVSLTTAYRYYMGNPTIAVETSDPHLFIVAWRLAISERRKGFQHPFLNRLVEVGIPGGLDDSFVEDSVMDRVATPRDIERVNQPRSRSGMSMSVSAIGLTVPPMDNSILQLDIALGNAVARDMRASRSAMNMDQSLSLMDLENINRRPRQVPPARQSFAELRDNLRRGDRRALMDEIRADVIRRSAVREVRQQLQPAQIAVAVMPGQAPVEVVLPPIENDADLDEVRAMIPPMDPAAHQEFIEANELLEDENINHILRAADRIALAEIIRPRIPPEEQVEINMGVRVIERNYRELMAGRERLVITPEMRRDTRLRILRVFENRRTLRGARPQVNAVDFQIRPVDERPLLDELLDVHPDALAEMPDEDGDLQNVRLFGPERIANLANPPIRDSVADFVAANEQYLLRVQGNAQRMEAQRIAVEQEVFNRQQGNQPPMFDERAALLNAQLHNAHRVEHRNNHIENVGMDEESALNESAFIRGMEEDANIPGGGLQRVLFYNIEYAE